MPSAPRDVATLAQLRIHVHEVLCEQEQLLANQFELFEIPLVRRNQACGIQFFLHGPRRVQLGAVWSSESNVIYYYDARGERSRKDQLSAAITISGESAA